MELEYSIKNIQKTSTIEEMIDGIFLNKIMNQKSKTLSLYKISQELVDLVVGYKDRLNHAEIQYRNLANKILDEKEDRYDV